MNNIMVDLETVGQTPGCGIISIGAVAFDPVKGLGAKFYVIVDHQSCLDAGLFDEESTLVWWGKQSEMAQAAFKGAKSGQATALPLALQQFGQFIQTVGGANARVWGNGADFDNAILSAAYRSVGQQTPWKFYNGRCYRTLKNLYPDIKLVREGEHHNALDDAITQAKHAITILKAHRA